MMEVKKKRRRKKMKIRMKMTIFQMLPMKMMRPKRTITTTIQWMARVDRVSAAGVNFDPLAEDRGRCEGDMEQQ
jgi:hypothetical protein